MDRAPFSHQYQGPPDVDNVELAAFCQPSALQSTASAETPSGDVTVSLYFRLVQGASCQSLEHCSVDITPVLPSASPCLSRASRRAAPILACKNQLPRPGRGTFLCPRATKISKAWVLMA